MSKAQTSGPDARQSSSDETRAAIARRAAARAIGASAQLEGMTTLLDDGVDKCLQGKTDLRQVLAVAGR